MKSEKTMSDEEFAEIMQLLNANQLDHIAQLLEESREISMRIQDAIERALIENGYPDGRRKYSN